MKVTIRPTAEQVTQHSIHSRPVEEVEQNRGHFLGYKYWQVDGVSLCFPGEEGCRQEAWIIAEFCLLHHVATGIRGQVSSII